jgi:pimeloyl-ACP methyl ester carboxylesterase
MPRLDLGEGQSIFYTDEGDGAPVVAVHGWSCDGGDWSWLAADLAADHRVIIPDLRGHGASTHRPGQRYTPRLFAADTLRLIEHLELKDVIVIGHSLGTTVASILAVDRADLVSALVLVDPQYGHDDATLVPALEAVRADPHGFAMAAFAAFGTDATPAWLHGWRRRRVLSTPAEVIAGTFGGLFDGDEGLGRRAVSEGFLRRRNVPTLAIYAAAGLTAFEESLPHGPHDEIAVWDGYGHFLHQEAPDRFAAAIRAWLGRLPAPGSAPSTR